MKYRLVRHSDIEYFKGMTTSKLYRVKALKDFGDVSKGDIGGVVEGTHNLSQEGNCWIYDDGAVLGSGVVKGNAKVKDKAVVVHGCILEDNCMVGGDVVIGPNFKLGGKKVIAYKTFYDIGKAMQCLHSNNKTDSIIYITDSEYKYSGPAVSSKTGVNYSKQLTSEELEDILNTDTWNNLKKKDYYRIPEYKMLLTIAEYLDDSVNISLDPTVDVFYRLAVIK
jgi:carbonic anhydrase/acetyltransferase-like protein (isoleucine patch superfamily)